MAWYCELKPLQLVKDALLDCSDRNGLVLDAFAGSGTTLVAAHEVSRIGYGIDLDPAYCDVILKRFLAKGVDAKHASSNLSFSQLLKGARQRHSFQSIKPAQSSTKNAAIISRCVASRRARLELRIMSLSTRFQRC